MQVFESLSKDQMQNYLLKPITGWDAITAGSLNPSETVLLLPPSDTASDASDIIAASLPDDNPPCLCLGLSLGDCASLHICQLGKLPGRGETSPKLTRELNLHFHSSEECPQQYTLGYMGQVPTSSPFLSYLHLNFLHFAIILKY